MNLCSTSCQAHAAARYSSHASSKEVLLAVGTESLVVLLSLNWWCKLTGVKRTRYLFAFLRPDNATRRSVVYKTHLIPHCTLHCLLQVNHWNDTHFVRLEWN